MADYKLPADVMDVLQRSTIEGNTLRLPEGQLERDLYNRVNKALANAGGHWNRGAKGHVFSGDPRPKLGLMLESGVAVDEQKKYQAFYTPEKLAYQVAGLAMVRGHVVLEPSAGQGALIDACLGHEAEAVHAIELNPENKELLVEKCDAEADGPGQVAIGDFLEMEPDWFARWSGGKSPGLYTRIVMNPPFTRNQDIRHVEHALKWLAPGGILVAIMLDNPDRLPFQALTQDLDRRIADGLCYSFIKVPGGTFKDTDVRTLILKVKAPVAVAVTPPSPATPPARTPACLRETALETVTGIPPEPTATIEPTSDTVTMKLTIPRKALVAALAAVKPASAPNGTLPILANVLLVANEKSVTLTASDADLNLRQRVALPLPVSDPGKTTVRAGLLYDIARQASGEAVNLRLVRNALHVECGTLNFKLATLDPDDFPPMSRVKDPVEFALPEAMLHAMLARTAFAQSSDTTRMVFCGSVISLNGQLTVAACDGRRLGLITAPPPAKVKAELILPAKTVRELLRLLNPDEKGEGEVQVSANKNIVQFAFGDTVILSKLIEGDYPDVKKIIPEGKQPVATLQRLDLLQAVNLVTLVADWVELKFAGKSLHISSSQVVGEKKDLFGEASDSLLVDCSRPATIILGTRYLLDALNATDAEELQFFEDSGVAMLKAANEQDWLAVIAGRSDEPEAK